VIFVVDEVEYKQLTQSSLSVIDELCALFPHWKRASVQKKISNIETNGDLRFVALKDGKIIGHIRIIPGHGLHKHRVEITSLVVAPENRHHGVAQGLMLFALSTLPKTKSLVILAASKKNKPAIALYKKLGFVKYGALNKASTVNGKYVDNILMKKDLL
jgi:ribosomal protein S18 acetylase RimI-like enzyme